MLGAFGEFWAFHDGHKRRRTNRNLQRHARGQRDRGGRRRLCRCQNPSLVTLGVLDGVVDLPGGLDVQDNAALTVLGGASLRTVGGDLRVAPNRSLCQSVVDALVARVEVGGSVFVIGNAGC